MLIKSIERSRLSLSQGWLGGILCDLARSATSVDGKRETGRNEKRPQGKWPAVCKK